MCVIVQFPPLMGVIEIELQRSCIASHKPTCTQTSSLCYPVASSCQSTAFCTILITIMHHKNSLLGNTNLLLSFILDSKRTGAFGAEKNIDVLKALDTAYPSGGRHPRVVYYDRACFVLKSLKARVLNPLIARFIVVWSTVLWIVDAFHFVCHSKTDTLCQTCCNPTKDEGPYSQLFVTDEKGLRVRRFNTEAAEQANSWMESFGKIVSSMHGHTHDFFLDLAVEIRNEQTAMKQKRAKKNPHFVPLNRWDE